DESGRINPNLASGALLDGLLRAAGDEPEKAAMLARAITQWVGSAAGTQTSAELLAEYHDSGLDYAPPGSPLESIDELERVHGMRAELLSALRPHLTLYGPGEPNPISADPVVAAAIVLAGGTSGLASGALVTTPNTVPDKIVARIRVTAKGPGNAQLSRTAIARIAPSAAPGYALLAWETNDI